MIEIIGWIALGWVLFPVTLYAACVALFIIEDC